MLAKFVSSTKVIFTKPKVEDGNAIRVATDEEMLAMGYKTFIETTDPQDGRNWDCIYSDGETITQEWVLSETQPSNDEIRKRNYEICKCIEYNGKLITVDTANRLVTQYQCEGIQKDDLINLIHQRKEAVRQMFPEVDE